MLKKIHSFFALFSFLIILSFWSSTLIVELFYDYNKIALIKSIIVFPGLYVLIPAIMITAISGNILAKSSTNIKLIKIKKRRMPFIALIGLFIMLPSAIYLDYLASLKLFTSTFYTVQGIELIGGGINLSLMFLNIRDSKNKSIKKTQEAKRIDVHHHILPKEYLEKLDSIGISKSLGVSFPDWTPEMSLKFMDKTKIKTAIMSISSPGVSFKDNKEFSLGISRLCNEYMAKVKKDYPMRFGGFASIPLHFVKESIDELTYAIDELGLDGVCLMTNYDGKYLGDESFEEFFKEMNKRKTIVFIHPIDPAEKYDPHLSETGIPNSLIEVTFETTRVAANLLYNDTISKYPNIKYIFSHGGGTIPYLAWRLAMIRYAQKNKKAPTLRALYDFIIKGSPNSGLEVLRDMYYDTALTSGSYALNTLNEFVGTSRIVYGSDFPFAKVSPIVTENLDKHSSFSKEDHEKINYQNSHKLFLKY